MQMRQLVNGPEAKATGIQDGKSRQADRERVSMHTHLLLFLFSLYVLLNFHLSFWTTHACLDEASEWHTCPSLCRHNRQWFALPALLSLSILIEWWASERKTERVWLHCPESSPHFTQLRNTASLPCVLIPIQQDRLDKECGWMGVQEVNRGGGWRRRDGRYGSKGKEKSL